MTEPVLKKVAAGWAAYGNGWAVHGNTQEEALQKFREREERRKEIDEQVQSNLVGDVVASARDGRWSIAKRAD